MNRYIALLAVTLTLAAAGCSSSRSSGTVLPPVAGMRVAAGRASLNFRPVYCTIPAYAGPSSQAGVTVSQSDCSTPDAAALPSTPAGADAPGVSVILPADPKAYPGSSGIRYVLGPADLTGSAVSGATETMNTTTGQYSVQLTLTSAGAAEFDTLAATRFACYTQDPSSPSPCSEEAFELQGVVESAPTFQAARFNGHVEITGNFSRAQAQALANELKPGSADEHYVPLPTG